LVGVDVIGAALAAGASAGVSGTATEAVKDTYELLKQTLKRRFAGRDSARAALNAHETEPGRWQALIGQDLHESGAASDEQIQNLARELLGLADPGSAVTVTASGTVHGAVGVFHGPVTFDQRVQAPPSPSPPAAG
jgi:hypothetical protein